MKLTTDRHEASRGLFATAELLVLPPDAIIIINVVHEVQNKYKHKRKAKRKAKKNRKAKNMTVTTSLYAQIFYGRTAVIFTNSTVR